MTPQERADAEADAAHDDAVHASRPHRPRRDRHPRTPRRSRTRRRRARPRSELIEASAGAQAAPPAPIEDDVILLPGETRSPRSASAPRDDFAPRESARIGSGNPRSRFQRPFRGGGRDRGRDNRGGRSRWTPQRPFPRWTSRAAASNAVPVAPADPGTIVVIRADVPAHRAVHNSFPKCSRPVRT